MREKVLEFLENKYSAVSLIDIFDGLNLSTVEDQIELDEEIAKLNRENIVYITKNKKGGTPNYLLYKRCPDFRIGKVQILRDGNAFVVLDKDEYKDESDIYVHHSDLGLALNGDIVLVKIEKNKEGRRYGLIFNVINRDLHNLLGVIKADKNGLYFELKDDKKINVTVDEESLRNCVEGEVVVVSIIDDLGKNRYIGKVSHHLGHKDDPKLDILEIAAKHGVFTDFSEATLKQLETIPSEISDELLEEEKRNRKDLTNEIIFTIDGEDTKDIDDAISLTMVDGNYNLKVSIADVSHYVTEGSPLDVDAFTRGTSNYLAYSVIPMLPHQLSNGICSLNENVIRCAMTCDMIIDHTGNVISSQIYPSLIKSSKKMNYTSVNHLLEDNIIDEGYEEYADTLKNMQELAHLIRERRLKKGAGDFGSTEPKIICNDDGVPIDIKAYIQGEGQKLIEDFMVIANETVASTFACQELPSIYRVHGTPKPEKVQSFINFAMASGHQIKGKFEDITNPKMFQSLLKQIEGGSDEIILKNLAIRTMPKAYYSKENIGHFGLAVRAPFEAYTHFTSPIRRYPDLQVHRLIRSYFIENNLDEKNINYWDNNLESIAKHCSEREIEAVEAEREVDKMKMAEYMEQHIGEEYDAIVSGMTSHGFFVQLANLVEGFVSIESLDGNNYEYYEDMQVLRDAFSKKAYRIGDMIKVKCVRASKEEMQIDFEEVKVLALNNEEEEQVKYYGRSK